MARKNTKPQPEPKTGKPAETETAPEEKLYKPEPIRRGRARDYSHWQQSVRVTLKTDTAQRFLERHFNSTNKTLQYLDYMLVILRDDAFAKPLAEELAALFPRFMDEARSTAGKLKAMADQADLPFAVEGTTYDNARTYQAVLLSGNSVDMLAAISALDTLAVTIDEVRGKRVITTFDRKNLLEMWVDALTQRMKRVRAIAGSVRDKNNELKKEREEKQAKELEERNRERAKAEAARKKEELPETQPVEAQSTETEKGTTATDQVQTEAPTETADSPAPLPDEPKSQNAEPEAPTAETQTAEEQNTGAADTEDNTLTPTAEETAPAPVADVTPAETDAALPASDSGNKISEGTAENLQPGSADVSEINSSETAGQEEKPAVKRTRRSKKALPE